MGFEPTPSKRTATWTQRLRPLGHLATEMLMTKDRYKNQLVFHLSFLSCFAGCILENGAHSWYLHLSSNNRKSAANTRILMNGPFRMVIQYQWYISNLTNKLFKLCYKLAKVCQTASAASIKIAIGQIILQLSPAAVSNQHQARVATIPHLFVHIKSALISQKNQITSQNNILKAKQEFLKKNDFFNR